MHLQRLVEEQENAIGIITVEDAALAAGGDPVVGDGVANDGPSLQAAITYAENNGLALYWGNKTYRTGQTLLIGTAANVWTRWISHGANNTRILGNINGPLVRTAGTGINLTYNDTTARWEKEAGAPASNGCRCHWVGIGLQQENRWGSCCMFYNLWYQSVFIGCGAGATMGGFIVSQGFDYSFINCRVDGLYFAAPHNGTLAEDHWYHAYGFYIPGHGRLVGCSATGCGVGVQVIGVQNAIHARLEVNGIGLRGGLDSTGTNDLVQGTGSLSQDGTGFGGSASWDSGTFNCSFESNYYGLVGRQIRATVIGTTKFQGFTGAAPTGASPQSAIRAGTASYLNMPGTIKLTGDWAVSAIQSLGGQDAWLNFGAGWMPVDRNEATTLPEAPGSGWRYTGTTPGTAFTVYSGVGPGYRGFVEQGTGAGTVTITAAGFTIKFGSGATTTSIGDRVWCEVYPDGEVGIWLESRG